MSSVSRCCVSGAERSDLLQDTRLCVFVFVLKRTEKWPTQSNVWEGCRIKVKFREEQGLKAVDGNTQSGGETSLSVMLFILSMQQITECPFRVVDEINQGLDKNYERAIFERIVEYSSKDDCSQCFLITPKLQGGMLNDVGKHITVLNIFKGRGLSSQMPFFSLGLAVSGSLVAACAPVRN